MGLVGREGSAADLEEDATVVTRDDDPDLLVDSSGKDAEDEGHPREPDRRIRELPTVRIGAGGAERQRQASAGVVRELGGDGTVTPRQVAGRSPSHQLR